MITTMIIDDEPNCCKVLETMIGRFCPDLRIQAVCHSGAAAILAVETAVPQLVFLDIEMPHMNGFEFLGNLPAVNFDVIFTTSYDQYAIKAIRFSALDYLLKPIDRAELIMAVDRVSKKQQGVAPVQLENLLQKLQLPKTLLKKIALPTMDGLHLEDVESIISCSSDSNYTRFLMKDNRKLIVSRPLKEMEELLSDHPFLRVHNSFLVNLNQIQKYVRGDGGYLIMSDGSTIDVSRSRKELLLQKLQPDRL